MLKEMRRGARHLIVSWNIFRFSEKKVTSEEGFKNIVSTLKADPENYDYHGPVAELMPRNFAELKQVFKRYGAEMEAFAKTASKAENFIKL